MIANAIFSALNAWSIVDESNKTAITFTGFISFESKKESRVTNYPLEQGNFYSYNKVNTPLQLNATIAKQGNSSELQSFINTLSDYAENPKIIKISTPAITTPPVTISMFTYTHKVEDGINAVYADLHLQEIRQIPATNKRLSSGKIRNPSNASFLNGGKIQGKEVDSSLLYNVLSSF